MVTVCDDRACAHVRNQVDAAIVEPRMKRLLLVVAVVVGAGCSSPSYDADIAEPSVSAAPPSMSATTQPRTSAVMTGAVEQIGSLPFDIGPLPPSTTPGLSLSDVRKLIPSGQLAARFFLRPSDLATVTITFGLITDHSAIDGTAAGDPTFVGYVIEGGHSTCSPNGPPSSDGTYPADAPCHALFILDADSGHEIGGFSEIGD
ncbi:MAG: hypothetical protein JWN62_891 [Acidimicrobiales bacterium]|nr:hypothetical protein [Acidimicrobiales bacterium]